MSLKTRFRRQVLLHAGHAIFKGHFPGQPILPGVCMMEMITEIMGEQSEKVRFAFPPRPLIKFLLMIDPGKNPRISFEIKYQALPEIPPEMVRFFRITDIHEVSDEPG